MNLVKKMQIEKRTSTTIKIQKNKKCCLQLSFTGSEPVRLVLKQEMLK